VTKETKFIYCTELRYRLFAFMGTDSAGDVVTVQSRVAREELTYSYESPSINQVQNNSPLDLNISWLVKNWDAKAKRPRFTIDR
jgi:hypothetical protein